MCINNQSIPFEDALDVYLNVPTAGTSFTFEHALVHVGTAPFLARLDCNISKLDRMFRVKTQGAFPAHSNDDDAIKERVELLLKKIPCSPKLAKIMRLASCRDDQITFKNGPKKKTPLYQACNRLLIRQKRR